MKFVKINGNTNLCREIFEDIPIPNVISLVGAGGKTTLLFALAKNLSENGFTVAATTTTHIFYPEPTQCTSVITDGNIHSIEYALSQGMITVGTPVDNGKLSAPSDEILHYLRKNAFLLIEADGSHQLPIKVPRKGEPVLYTGTDIVIAVCGLNCLNQPIGHICHRAELAMKMLNVDKDYRLTEKDVAKLLYNSYENCAKEIIYVLNQVDTIDSAYEIAKYLSEMGAKRIIAIYKKSREN